MYLVSSCLVGINCRYNAKSIIIRELKEMVDSGRAIAVCPEVLAGLATPRKSCEIQKSSGAIKVIGKSGKDFTCLFEKGAKLTLEICKKHNISKAVLQSRSPSCGFGKIYDGTFSGKLIDGNGITAELLYNNGIEIYTENNWHQRFENK